MRGRVKREKRHKLSEQTGQERNEGNADKSDAASGHKLFHALAFCARIVVAISFQKIDRAPNSEASAERHHEGLEDTNCTIEKCHI